MTNSTGIDRRAFLLGASSLAFADAVGASALGESPRLVFGVLSDLHVTDLASCEVLRKVLEFFRERDVDAVMVAGDMTDHGILCQLENVAQTWYSVFPGDCGKNGKKVEKLFICGNHDSDSLAYRDSVMTANLAVHGLTFESAAGQSLRKLGLGKCWEKCFNEPYEPIYRKRVRGYDFIGVHWQGWSGQDCIEPWFAAHEGDIDASKPFFFFQHQHPYGTVFAQDIWCPDRGQSVRALSKHPNAVAFSGHSHYSLTDGRCYWQGEFTSIGTSTLSYVCLPGGRRNKPDYRKNLDARQGQVVSVYLDRLEIDRFDFLAMERLDEPVVLMLPARADSFGVRAVQVRNRPLFPKGAKVVVDASGGAIDIRFPAAVANADARPYDYKVVFEGKTGGGKGVRKEFLWFHPGFVFSKARCMADRTLSFRLPLNELGSNFAELRASVIARNCYGGVGNMISDSHS